MFGTKIPILWQAYIWSIQNMPFSNSNGRYGPCRNWPFNVVDWACQKVGVLVSNTRPPFGPTVGGLLRKGAHEPIQPVIFS